MTEFIFHELERAVSHTMDIISDGTLQRTTIKILHEQLKTLHKRVAAFDELTSEKRQHKSSLDLGKLVEDTLENHVRKFRSSRNRRAVRQTHSSPSWSGRCREWSSRFSRT